MIQYVLQIKKPDGSREVILRSSCITLAKAREYHFMYLKNGIHPNKQLQALIKKHGLKAVEIIPVQTKPQPEPIPVPEPVEKPLPDIPEPEQFPEAIPEPDQAKPFARKGRKPLSEKTKQKIRASMARRRESKK